MTNQHQMLMLLFTTTLTTTYWKTINCVCVYNIIYNVLRSREGGKGGGELKGLDSTHAECDMYLLCQFTV